MPLDLRRPIGGDDATAAQDKEGGTDADKRPGGTELLIDVESIVDSRYVPFLSFPLLTSSHLCCVQAVRWTLELDRLHRDAVCCDLDANFARYNSPKVHKLLSAASTSC